MTETEQLELADIFCRALTLLEDTEDTFFGWFVDESFENSQKSEEGLSSIAEEGLEWINKQQEQ